MRIATSNHNDRSVELMQQRQQAMQRSQEQLISGKRVSRASDDPTAAARVERALAQEMRLQASQRSLEASRSVMLQAESSMGEAGELLQRARELLVEAGNASYSDAERRTLAERMRGLREDLLKVANRGDGSGGFIFGGQGTGQAPFVDMPPKRDSTGKLIEPAVARYHGVPGQVVAQAGEPLPMTVDGEQAFMRSPTGNGVFVTQPAAGNGPGAWIDGGSVLDPSALTGKNYEIVFSASGSATTYQVNRVEDGTSTPVGSPQPFESGKAISFDGLAVVVKGAPATGDTYTIQPSTPDLSVFATLERAANELAEPRRSNAQVMQTVTTGLREIDSALNTVLSVRSRLGSVLERTETVEKRLGDLKLQAQTEKAAAEDLDMAQAVSDFKIRQTSYDAALQAYSMVQRLSLFDYLR
jgi:flagellar hook-associated protein 3 FlgL